MNTILVVDDTPGFRMPIVAWLRMAGYQPVEASNGREALAVAREQHPALILLDLAMPEMDGLGFLRARQDDAKLVAIPVILLTAVTDEQYVAQAQDLGIADRLLKAQFSMQDLLRRIEQQLGRPAPGTDRLPTATAGRLKAWTPDAGSRRASERREET